MKEIYPVPDKFKEMARISEADYFKRYQDSIEQPEVFWAQEAKNIDWIKPFTQVKNTSFNADNFKIEWFADGELNVSANCLDRHLKDNPLKPAIIWEGDHPSRHKIISFSELHDEVCRFANVLKNKAFARVIVWCYICQWCLSRLPCWPVHELVLCIVWCLVGSHQTHWLVVSKIVKQN
jgi:acetyl-CoA synthetase